MKALCSLGVPCTSGGQMHSSRGAAVLSLNQRQRVSRRALHQAADQQISDYNAQMQQRMGWDGANPYEYHPERGIFFHETFPRIICGSQPRTPDDITLLHEQAGVGVIVSLQQDKDLQHWGVNLGDLQHKAQQLGIAYQRCPAVDFDSHSLRHVLPQAGRIIQASLQQQSGRVYVHCTAGLGRAPAACIAHSFWFSKQQLEEAYSSLTSIRPCGPKKEAIRGATYDLLDARGFDTFQHLPEISYSLLSPEQKAAIQGKLS